MYYITYISDADISRLSDDNDIIIKITEFVFSCFTKLSDNKYKVLFKRILMTLKSYKKRNDHGRKLFPTLYMAPELM